MGTKDTEAVISKDTETSETDGAEEFEAEEPDSVVRPTKVLQAAAEQRSGKPYIYQPNGINLAQ